jgi:hypothetical protein
MSKTALSPSQVVKLVLGTTKIILTTPEHEDESRTLNICVWHEGSAHQQQPTGVAAVDSVTSSGSQVEPVDMEKMSKEEFVEKLRGWIMVLASLFASMTFQAGLNPPKQFEADLVSLLFSALLPLFLNTFLRVCRSLGYTPMPFTLID